MIFTIFMNAKKSYETLLGLGGFITKGTIPYGHRISDFTSQGVVLISGRSLNRKTMDQSQRHYAKHVLYMSYARLIVAVALG